MSKASTRAETKINMLMERACQALERTDYFECEKLAEEALILAHHIREYDLMARILMPLEEARRQKRLLAADAGVAGTVPEQPGAGFVLTPGCWLVEPPRVGADGRELQHRADEAKTPIILLTREPLTKLGRWPIVVIGVTTIRAYVEPPKKTPTVAWFLDAAEALGHAGIEDAQTRAVPETRVNALVEAVLTIRDDDALHQELARACLEAARNAQPKPARSSRKKSSQGVAQSG